MRDHRTRAWTTTALQPLHGVLMSQAVTAPVAKALLEARADVSARDQDGDTPPLHIAANRTDDVAIIEALLSAGANLRAENEDRNRPVDLAWDIRGKRGVLAPRGTGGNAGTRTDFQRQPHLVRRGLGQRLALRRVDRYRAGGGAACSHRYGIGRCGRLSEGPANDGTPVATDDDGGSESNARVEFRAPYAGITSSSPRVTRLAGRGV